MFSPKEVKFLEGFNDSEATSNRPSFRRPCTPHPRKGKQLEVSTSEDEENIKIGSKQSIGTKSSTDTSASSGSAVCMIFGSPLQLKVSTSGDKDSMEIGSKQSISKKSIVDSSSAVDDSKGPPPFISSSLISSILSPLSTWSSSVASRFSFSPLLTPSVSSRSTSIASDSISSPSSLSSISPGSSSMTPRSGKRVRWAEHLETETSIPTRAPILGFGPGQQYKPPHLPFLQQAIARAKLSRIPLDTSDPLFWVFDEDDDKHFYDEYFDIDMRCERRRYRKLKKTRRKAKKLLESSGKDTGFYKTVDELENELENLRNAIVTFEDELQKQHDEVAIIENVLQNRRDGVVTNVHDLAYFRTEGDLEDELQDLRNVILTLEDELQNQRHDIATIEKMLQKPNNEVVTIENDLQNLRL